MTLLDDRPAFSAETAARITHDLYGIAGAANELPSDRDQNFRVTTNTGREWVLKIANAREDRAALAMQNAIMAHLNGHVAVPEVVETVTGDEVGIVHGAKEKTHFIRLISYLPGKPLALFKPHSAELLTDFGRFMGRLSGALVDFDHPAAHRDLHWDLQHAGREVEAHLEFVDSAEQRVLVTRFRQRFTTEIAPCLPDLRRSVIHGDANDYNILVTGAKTRTPHIGGIIDFGDAVYSCTVFELAVAAAYVILDKRDPLTAAAHVIGGYNTEFALTEQEISLLYNLIAMRLCVSVCISAYQQTVEPDNAYLTISQNPAWAALARWADMAPSFALAVFRHACGLPPIVNAPALVSRLAARGAALAPVTEYDLRTTPLAVFDFSVGSPDLGNVWTPQNQEAWSAWIFGRMAAGGAKVGIGRYDEPRLAYATDAFAQNTDEFPERRTIHIGIDLFLPAGSSVYAPLDGFVHSYRDNDAHLDYGPTIILQHSADGTPFYTLYGHLSRESLISLKQGMPVQQGKKIAEIGRLDENGHWPPHLHFQLITDMLGMAGGFHGVAPPSQRAVWHSLCPDPNLILNVPEAAFPPPTMMPTEIAAERARRIGSNLSVSYRPKPLTMLRGARQYLYDHNGQVYLDCVNNVAHVGHCHPLVVEAAGQQQTVLNTNTRYLHPHLVTYAARLAATLPDPLSVCFFVNSGSEANDLALRLARTHTGRRDLLIVDGAYHGNLGSLIDISPYKFDGPGGEGQRDYVHRTLLPDGYRGQYKGFDVAAGQRYGLDVREKLTAAQATDRPIAAFICESVLGCGGQIVLPDGYLQAAFAHVRAAGGVCIADEVQVGFGRVGSHFWGFETQNVVPDIVTMGKPMGNGHPLAAVVTTPAIAASFANGMEYFNTFGGNPVSCAVGMAVLDAVEQDGLQANALRVGAYLMDGLRALQTRHALVGHVRGLGLFVGVELVRNRATLEPAAEEAATIALRMREHGILISTDGPLHNVLKLKPPLCFSAENADRVVATLDKILAEDCVAW
ncbi:MAG: aminotransferase class III-fold pyridoxal phosphate-dependent enzyme [Anaerolineae bacterium]|nr:aminotransferase class III-fold pyridoxal phosphate-dependent enzyme [Anaerolineae bacterium]